MSSFFLKGKQKKVSKRKAEKLEKLRPKRTTKGHNLESYDSSSSDLDLKQFSAGSESESEHESVGDRKLRFAKAYLEEIRRKENMRAEVGAPDDDAEEDVRAVIGAPDDDAVAARLRQDHLERQGRLRKRLADRMTPPNSADTVFVRAREHRLPLTCVCITTDGRFLYTASKCGGLVKWSLEEKRKVALVTHKTSKIIRGSITAMALSSDGKFLATGDQSVDINIWDATTLQHLRAFKGHKDKVTALAFRRGTHSLYSASADRSVKCWSLDEMSYVETLFGHQAPITSIDAGMRERAVTAGGRDSTLRVWKIVEESQLIFNAPIGSVDEVRLLDEEHFVSGSDDGSISIWSVLKKKPLATVLEAHGCSGGVPRWITSLATIFNTDVIASGSHDGAIKIWKVAESYREIIPIFNIEVCGFVNGIQFSLNGDRLFAVIGQEHKNVRCWREPIAKNGILHVKLKLS